ncbi:hypothetical protein AVEN_194662-1 [Araneus ventricosus]|uniref:Uncharacterized protein n=1 Tax=Araneus ventricosus TaxID=182803 RepID=A0A4Y2A7U6_ARAVE|nr:hypothetical protein AVEN_194662-1 [Araneus ventricosus]
MSRLGFGSRFKPFSPRLFPKFYFVRDPRSCRLHPFWIVCVIPSRSRDVPNLRWFGTRFETRVPIEFGTREGYRLKALVRKVSPVLVSYPAPRRFEHDPRLKMSRLDLGSRFVIEHGNGFEYLSTQYCAYSAPNSLVDAFVSFQRI